MTDERAARIERLGIIRNHNFDPYPARATRTQKIASLLTDFEHALKAAHVVTLVGRVRARRQHGASVFIDLEDGSGRIQAYLKKDQIGEAAFTLFNNTSDLGDFFEVTGTPMHTQRGEPTLAVKSLRLIAKALRPLPSQWYGLVDVEERFRHREVDFAVNEKMRTVIELRAKVLKSIRRFFDERGFLEVETPILQSIPGGANARPFITHHESLDHDFYLRIAPELYLKRLVVGGFERVYEVARCFRNEGIDRAHNPEFTQVEFYHAYADYLHLMDLTEELLTEILEATGRGLQFSYGGEELNWSRPFARTTFTQALADYGLDISMSDDLLRQKLQSLNVEVGIEWGRGDLLDACFKAFVRPHLLNPTFITNHPSILSPLAKTSEKNPDEAERFQLLVCGMEVVNAYSEQNDPLSQRLAFEAQEKLRVKGNIEAQRLDEDFLQALEYGLPPTAGWGMGIDRLVALLADAHNIKEVIAFPTLRPKDHA